MLSSTTNFRVPSLAWQLSVVLLAFVPTAWAATTAVCQPGWEWANNSEDQNPCQVAGYLQAPCLGYLTYVLGPLENGSFYRLPTKNDTRGLKCDCNTVIYSLYSACEACQDAPTRSWGEWSQNCNDVYVAQYPFNIPGGTAIPRWAFINVTGGSFDATDAQNVGRDPEAVGNFPVTLNLSSTSSRSPSTLPISGRPSSSVSSSSRVPSSTIGGGLNGTTSNDENVPAIIGGVVGAVVGLASVLLLLFWLYLRRRRPGTAPPYVATRPLSQRSISIRSRGSYYPPSVPAYKYEHEMDKSGWQIPEVYSRANAPPQEESTYSPTEFDVQTTYNSPVYPSERERDGPPVF